MIDNKENNRSLTLNEILGRNKNQSTQKIGKKNRRNGQKRGNKKTNKKNNKINSKVPCGCMGKDVHQCTLQQNNRSFGMGYKSLKQAIPPIVSGSQRDLSQQVRSHTMPLIERLFSPKNAHEGLERLDRGGLYPASYGGPAGPKCNWRKCSNKGGCGSDCVCHPAGKYGWRCIPKCCIRADGSPPCRFVYNYPVQCTLPCSSWPGLCQENYWNPYHVFQGPLQYPKNQSATLTAL